MVRRFLQEERCLTSRAVIVTGRGGPEVLELVERPIPEPKRGQVRIRVERAGVAFGDVMRRRGVFAPRPPFTPGYDVVGVVDDVQLDDKSLVGKRVACMMPTPGIGGYADHVCVDVARLVHVPDGVTPTDAISLGLNYITAWQLIHRIAKLQSGQRVLVHGAAGGVGTAVLDLGRLHGLEMYGTASQPKHDVVRSFGAMPVDYRTEDFVQRIAALTGDGVDAVFDSIGGEHLRRSHQTLRKGGTLVSVGASGDVDKGLGGVVKGMLPFTSLKFRPDGRRVRLYLITATPGTGWKNCRDDWAALVKLKLDGKLHPIVGAELPLSDVRRAHEMMDRASVSGKLVLVCN